MPPDDIHGRLVAVETKIDSLQDWMSDVAKDTRAIRDKVITQSAVEEKRGGTWGHVFLGLSALSTAYVAFHDKVARLFS